MAISFSCDRCGYKTTEAGRVVHYLVEMTAEQPVKSCEVDLCDKCIETAWKVIRDQFFRADKQG